METENKVEKENLMKLSKEQLVDELLSYRLLLKQKEIDSRQSNSIPPPSYPCISHPPVSYIITPHYLTEKDNELAKNAINQSIVGSHIEQKLNIGQQIGGHT